MQERRVIGTVQVVYDVHFVDLLLHLALLLLLHLPVQSVEHVVYGLLEVIQSLPALERLCSLVRHLPKPLLFQVVFIDLNGTQNREPSRPV